MELTGNNETFDQKSPIFLFYQFIAPLIVWYFGLTSYKKLHNGKMSFKDGVKEGFRMSLVFGIVSPFIFVAYYLINPGIVDFIKTAYQMPDADNNTIIAFDMIVQLVAALIGGTIYAAILSFFLKTKSEKA
jgi:hypothetical protein